MQFLTTLVAATSILSFASASPAVKEFHLKTELKEGQTNTDFDGLYVQTYHVGAGFNAAVLQKGKGSLARQHLNKDGEVVFVRKGEEKYPSKFLLLQPYDTESGWAPTQINFVSDSSKKFFFNSKGHLTTKKFSNDFGGWRVCDWVHGVPELFHGIDGFDRGVPSSCALVNLVAEAI